jgi:hypothetical protein
LDFASFKRSELERNNSRACEQSNSAFILIDTIALTVSGLNLFLSASQTLPTTKNTLSQNAFDAEMLNKADTSFLIYRRFLFLNIVANGNEHSMKMMPHHYYYEVFFSTDR